MSVRAKFLMVAVLAMVAFQASAGYRRGKLLWACEFSKEDVAKYRLGGQVLASDGFGCTVHPTGGRSGDGAAYFKSPDKQHSAMFDVVPNVAFFGLVHVEAEVRGVDLGPGIFGYNGPKVMFPYQATKDSPRRYPQMQFELGSFDWKTWVIVEDVPETAVGLRFSLGLENAPGEFWIDSIRVYRAEQVPDEVIEAPFNAAAAKIPRGAFVGRHNSQARRGVMSGADLSDPSLQNLADWGGNVMRLQLYVDNTTVSTLDDYYRAFAEKLDRAEDIMNRCRKHDIRIILDLHGGPGCKSTKHASNVVPDDYDTAAICHVWRMIARRFKDHPMTYAYDILNEPSTTPETWHRVVTDVMNAVRPIDPKTPFMMESVSRYYENVIYSPHFYSPHTLTHMGVGGPQALRWTYPGYINGVYWDKEQMRCRLKDYIDFQRAHPGTKIHVGEFSCILWAKGAEKYIRDAIDLFEEYGWGWCYHAYRECPFWDVEYDHDGAYTIQRWQKATRETERKKELVKGLSYNRVGPFDQAVLHGETDRPCLIDYAPNEEMSFTLSLQGAGKVPEGTYFVSWKRTGDDGQVAEGKVDVTRLPHVIRTRLGEPGFVRVEAFVVDAHGECYLKPGEGGERRVFFDGGAGVQVDRLVSHPEPADFDAFWAKQAERLERVPISAERIEVTSPNPKVRLFAVEIACVGLRPVTGYLSVPKAVRKGTLFPARLRTQGYGDRVCAYEPPTSLRENEIALIINSHGQKLAAFGATEADCKALQWEIRSNGFSHAFDPAQNADPETAYFNGMVLRVKRALQYLKTLPEWNGRDLIASGGSQAGLQTIWAAGCGEGVTLAESSITWCCDIYTNGKLRKDPKLKLASYGWYVVWTEAMGYYDAVNFAKRIPKTCRTDITDAGLGDYVCPPTGLAKLYNNMTCPKRIMWVQGQTHGYTPPESHQTHVVASPLWTAE